jgi:hypothetical protein
VGEDEEAVPVWRGGSGLVDEYCRIKSPSMHCANFVLKKK